MTEATKELGLCQVRSRTDSPCTRPAVVKIRGVPFCERCAREQEAYFAIGELTQETQGPRNEPLVEALDRMRWERTGYIVETEVERAEMIVGNPE